MFFPSIITINFENRHNWVWTLCSVLGKYHDQTRPYFDSNFSFRLLSDLWWFRHLIFQVMKIKTWNYVTFRISFLPFVFFFMFLRDMCKFLEYGNDVILICTSILSLSKVVESLPFHCLKRPTLFADVLSVKEYPRNVLLKVHAKLYVFCIIKPNKLTWTFKHESCVLLRCYQRSLTCCALIPCLDQKVVKMDGKNFHSFMKGFG